MLFIDQKEFDGPIYEQVEKAYQFVLRHINMGQKSKGYIEMILMNFQYLLLEK